MIYVNINDKEQQLQTEGSVGTVIADICVVLKELCEENLLEPLELIDLLNDSFLTGMKLLEKSKRGADDETEYERSKKTIQSIGRRARRRLR